MMMNMLLSLMIATIVVVQGNGVVELTAANFEELVFASGKNAFIKFFAPWCGHCKKLKPDWDKLGEEYANSNSVLIGDVDCTVHQDLCGEYGVRGYPTLNYFADGKREAEPYQSGRDYASLKQFVADTLERSCEVGSIGDCTEKEQGFHAKWHDKSKSEIDAELARLEKMKSQSMKADLKKWLFLRINLLQQLSALA